MQSSCFDSLLSHNGLEQLVQPLGFPGEVQCAEQGAVTLKKVLPAILTGCAAAAVFSLISTRMDLDILKKLFGVLLLATGIRELCYRPKS